jgi:hypothetical protein
MARFIAIPLYDHTSDQEIGELLEELARLQLAQEPRLVEDVDLDSLTPDDPTPRHSARVDGRRELSGTPGDPLYGLMHVEPVELDRGLGEIDGGGA